MSWRAATETERKSLEQRALRYAIDGLRTEHPDASASRVIIRSQAIFGISLLAIIIVCLIFWFNLTLEVFVGISTVVYTLNTADRLYLFSVGLRHSPLVKVSDEDALAIPDEALPVYTVLVPIYDEPQIVERLITGLGQLNYPREKLDIKLLLEADDDATVNAVQNSVLAELDYFDVILVPAAEPRTKPKACNYGIQFARGELCTIYDAEDQAEPLQLRRVVVALLRLPPSTSCIQARLVYHNDRQNLLTRFFTAEYDQWFGYILPGLMHVQAPIPLGGTSNHMRVDTLREVGAWDPFNVTEDADLGIRLASAGYSTAVLDSITLEEANSDPINWVRQRSRWYKGYIQTFLVHMRHPLRLLRAVGFTGWLRFMNLMIGTPSVAVINVAFWGLTLAWIFGAPNLVRELFPTFTYYPALLSLLFGNAAIIFLGLISSRAEDKQHLVIAGLTVPLYWVLMSIAATKAFVQLITKPSYWEKTFHGLDSDSPD